MKLLPDRGSIVDRNGAGLALTVEAPSVYAVGREVRDPAAAARSLAAILGMDRGRARARLPASARDSRSCAAGSRPSRARRSPRRRSPASASSTSRAASTPTARSRRAWSASPTSTATACAASSSRRTPGCAARRAGCASSATARAASCSPMPETTWGTAGGDVALTLDAALQADAERALAAAIERTGARGGLVLAMDPHTGEVLSAAESPGFDPNRFRRTAYSATRSSAFLDAMEPGSAMKAFLVAGALEHGAIGARDVIDTEGGRMRVPGKTITDKHDFGPLDPAGVLRVSSNIGGGEDRLCARAARALRGAARVRVRRLDAQPVPRRIVGRAAQLEGVAAGRPRDDLVRPGHQRDPGAARRRGRRRSPTAACSCARA